MNLLGNGNSTMFSNMCTEEQFDTLLDLKRVYESEYVSLVSPTNDIALKISERIESEIEKYRRCVVSEAQKVGVYSELMFDFFRVIKKNY